MDIRHAMGVRAEPVSDPQAKDVTIRWLVGPDSGAPTFHMRQFDVGAGGHTPRHSHPWEHECYILQGQGKVLRPDGQLTPVKAGDVIYVQAGEEHQFLNDSWSKLTFLCMVPAAQCTQCKG